MKNTLMIEGGHPLKGTIQVQGSKNEALQILSAVLLYPGKTSVSNIPNILDVKELIKILEILGVVVENIGLEDTFIFDASNVNPENMKRPEFQQSCSKLRGSLMLAGAMLGRFGYAYMPTPGGDKIGIRPVTSHLKAFKDLGAIISEVDNQYKIELSRTKFFPEKIQLSEASVTGTANIILASVFYYYHHYHEQPRSFRIYNAACEPYVQNLCRLLQKYGAVIHGIGSNLLEIQPRYYGTTSTAELVEYSIYPDMIELGSLISLATVCGDGVSIECDNPLDVLGQTACTVFEKLGVRYEATKDGMFLPKHSDIEIRKPTTSGRSTRLVYDQIWPGLSPDHISTLITLAIFAKGTVIFEQRMFESRLNFTRTLMDMGAEIISAHDNKVMVVGNNRGTLRGITMSSPDIRAGMALLIAALAAQGKSTIHNASQIHRGYENIVTRLQKLGACIKEQD